MLDTSSDVIILGGGAAGMFAAACLAEQTDLSVTVIEKSSKLLSKVRVSGGGRCNVTNACFDPAELVTNYPRGGRELLGPFTRFGPGDMIAWLDEHGVEVKTEEDGRIFPVSDHSQTIIDAFLHTAGKGRVKILTGLTPVIYREQEGWKVQAGESVFKSRSLLVATGGFPKASQAEFIRSLGHTIIPPVSSLFTFNLTDKSVTSLMGVSMSPVTVRVNVSSFETEGPVLITHWGFSGPAILKLSAFAARDLAAADYRYSVYLNWTGSADRNMALFEIKEQREASHRKSVHASALYGIPLRLWSFLCNKAGIPALIKWPDLTRKQMDALARVMVNDEYICQGKTTFREEFVTCGGVPLEEVDMRTMESRRMPGLYFAGEVLNIDAVTGGFNFQAAWTTAWHAVQAIKKRA